MRQQLPIAVCLCALALLSCATGGPRPQPPQNQAAGAKPLPLKPPAHPPEKPGSELDSPAFALMPPEAKRYLADLSLAFAGADKRFLLAQAESGYERRVKPLFDETRYAALLYRIGPYAKDAPSAGERMPALDLGAVAGIRFTTWRENGPVIEIGGKLRSRNGKEEDALIVLLWKTDPPRILGWEP